MSEETKRKKSLFPRLPLKQALVLAEGIVNHSDGRIKRLTLFDQLNKSPDSGHTRNLITQSNAYGLTKGGFTAEYLEIQDRGRVLVSGRTDLEARQHLLDALTENPVFSAFFERYKNARVPSDAVLKDYLKDELAVPESDLNPCLLVILANAKDYGLIREFSGVDRFLPPTTLLEEAELGGGPVPSEELRSPADAPKEPAPILAPRHEPNGVAARAQVCVNVQIVIPESADAGMIDNIFASMAKHLRIAE